MTEYEYIENEKYHYFVGCNNEFLDFLNSKYYIIKYKYFISDEIIYCYDNKEIALKHAYKRAYMLFLQNQLIGTSDYYHPINDYYYLKDYIFNITHTTIVSKEIYQHKSDDEYIDELYTSIDITNNNSNIYCINNMKNRICFGMPEKYEIIGECKNGCCYCINWKYKIEYNFKEFIQFEEFNGNYIDIENDTYVKFISNINDDYLLK